MGVALISERNDATDNASRPAVSAAAAATTTAVAVTAIIHAVPLTTIVIHAS